MKLSNVLKQLIFFFLPVASLVDWSYKTRSHCFEDFYFLNFLFDLVFAVLLNANASVQVWMLFEVGG